MNNNLLISVITITKNNELNIERTIKSVLNQTYENIEYIIIDGNSTDNTLSIIKKYENKISKIVSEPDNGISSAFNKGVRLANGDYVIMMNSGDMFYDVRALEKMVLYIQNNNIDLNTVIYGEALILNKFNKFRLHISDHNLLLNECSICHQATLVPRQLLIKFPFDERLKYAMDYDLWLRFLKNNIKFFKINNVVVAVHFEGGVSSHPNGIIFKFIVKTLNTNYFNLLDLFLMLFSFINATLRQKFKKIIGENFYKKLLLLYYNLTFKN